MMRSLRALAAPLLLLAPLPAALAATTVVTAARMIDVLTGRVVERPQILIAGERITSVGRQGDPVPADAKRVDLGARTVLPGLIDMHVHLTSDPLYSGYRILQFTDAFWMTVGAANARRTLESGFTTVRNVGSNNYDDVGLKQGIEKGYIEGPRIVPASYAIGSTGGHCDATEFPPSISSPSTQIANSPDEYRALVRKMHKYGAEIIKVC